MIMNRKYTKKNVGANDYLPLPLFSVRFQWANDYSPLRLFCHLGLDRDNIHV